MVTTNFDRTLETAYERNGNPFPTLCIPRKDDYSVIQDRIVIENSHYLMKLHGDIENFRLRVFTLKEYEDLYGDIEKDALRGRLKPFPTMLKGLLASKRFLFVGSSMDSDRTMQLLHLHTGHGDIKHFAILPFPEVSRSAADSNLAVLIDPSSGDKWIQLHTREAYLSNHNILVVWYPYEQHDAVAVLLRGLLHECQRLGIPLPHLKTGFESKIASHPHGFFGRERTVSQIIKLSEKTSIVTVYGAPGIGKSEVCEEVVFQHQLLYPQMHHISVYLQGAFGYASLLGKLGKTLSLLPEAITEQILKNRIADLAHIQPIFLYMDNFEDALMELEGCEHDELNKQTLSFLEWAESVAGLSILLSCRERIKGRFCLFEIKPLLLADSWKLFQQVWQIQGGSKASLKGKGMSDAKKLLQELDQHPLSIVLMASQASEVPSLKALLEIWCQSNNARVDMSPSQHNANHVSLSAAIWMSYQRIRDDMTTRMLWGICSLLPGVARADILRKLFEDPDSLQQAVSRLIRLNLISCSESKVDGCVQYYMLSPLKRQIFNYVNSMEPGGEELSQKLLCTYYSNLLTMAQPGQTGWNQEMRFVTVIVDDVLFMVKYLFTHHQWDALWPIYHGLFNYYQFRCVESVEILSAVIDLSERSEEFIPKREVALTMSVLGDLQRRLGQVDEALQMYQMSEELFISETDDLGRANVLKSIGDIKAHLGQFDDALRMYQESENLYLARGNDLGCANVLCCMGSLQHALGHADEALKQYHMALQLYFSKDNDLRRATVLRKMGNLKCELHQFNTALKLYQEAEKLYRSEMNYLGCANVFHSMGDLYKKRNQWVKAQTKYEMALPLYRTEKEIIGLAGTLAELSIVYALRKNKTKAEETIREVQSMLSSIPYPQLHIKIEQCITDAKTAMSQCD